MLELRGVSKTYGDVVALKKTDLVISEGEIVALIGPSGCGKSTLLRLMNGLIRPDTGEVVFESEVLNAQNILRIRKAMGYVIQEGGLFPHLTARENTALLANTIRAPEIGSRVSELAELVQLAPGLLDRYPAQLSGGQRQRVSLMRALMLDLHVLLLDEPLGALDPMIRADLQKDLKDVFARLKKTAVLVTHDLGEAAYLSGRVLLMREGEIIQDSTPRELIEKPQDEFVEKFVTAQKSVLEVLA